MTDHTPTIKEELERKTVDLLQALASRFELGRLDERDLRTAAKVAWTLTSGLVDKSVSDLCTLTANGARDYKLSKTFIGNGKVIRVVWLPDVHGYEVHSINPATLEVQVRDKSSEIGLREGELNLLFAGLEKSGYKELK